MTEHSKIEWTDHTFNPWIGCTKVSPGCDNCYAEADFDRRRRVVSWGAGQPRKRTSPVNWSQPQRWQSRAVAFYNEHGRRQRVFCASLADVFDNEVPDEWRADLFRLIEQTPDLHWLLLTKRIGNAADMMFRARGGHLPLLANLWLGATIVNQDEARRDIPKLFATPAHVRFISVEPMLGPIDLGEEMVVDGRWHYDLKHAVDWVICGGESGPRARPMDVEWARSLRDQCRRGGVSFFFKQWGSYGADGVRRPKKENGALLDGVRWDQVPPPVCLRYERPGYRHYE